MKKRQPNDDDASLPPLDPGGAAAATRRRVQLLVALAVLGLLARFVLSAVSWGTTDTITFIRFAWTLDREGLMAAYRIERELNHPPLPAYWAYAAHLLSGRSEDGTGFAFIFRIPVILADVASACLLATIVSRRGGGGGGPVAAAAVAAAYAWNPVAILISGYHGNTDSCYAFLCLLAVYLVGDRRAPFWGGLALGAAINVKLIPVLLIPPLALSLRSRADAAKFLGALALMALPYVPPLLYGGPSFRHNVLAYTPIPNLWGVSFFLLMPTPPTAGAMELMPPAMLAYWGAARYLLMGLVLAWAVVARRFDRWSPYDVAAITLSLFLIVTPGFGVQYLVVLVPLLYAASPRLATIYGIAGGAFVLGAYFYFWDGGYPLSSLFDRLLPTPLGVIGLLTWGLLIYYVATTIARGVWQRDEASDVGTAAAVDKGQTASTRRELMRSKGRRA